MRQCSLTGRRRYRTQRHWGEDKLILQVEVRGLETEWNCGRAESEWITRWIDAKPEHLTMHDEPKMEDVRHD